VIGAVRRAADPAQEVHGRVAAVILAAGRSTRMGQLKQLLPWGSGRTMIAEVVQRLQTSGVHEIVVVTGAAREEVEAAVASTGVRVRFAFNPEFESSEMARSLQVGLDALPGNISAVLVALADQPQTEPWVVRAVIERWRQTLAPVVAPFFQDRRGHPLLFDCAMWPDLLKLPGSANPREFVRTAPRIERVEVETDSVLRDIDTPEDYGRERGA
jgi:molybdenum cofactor cytidylyltransferase